MTINATISFWFLKEMQANCFIMLIAGYETTSTSLGFISYELALNPDVQKKLQAEIDEHFPDEVRDVLRVRITHFKYFSKKCKKNSQFICKLPASLVPLMHYSPKSRAQIISRMVLVSCSSRYKYNDVIKVHFLFMYVGLSTRLHVSTKDEIHGDVR